ncbi:MAG: PIG-L family deacetylase [Anaerolineae bacterium]|nr:PIG-L family deacetylase [Anaerolineae bacterium]
MKFNLETAAVFVPDNISPEKALKRTTHLAIGAHPDDLEIMAIDGILQCYQRSDRWFTGVVVTNGGGSPRDDLYGDYTDEQMQVVRAVEQRAAATVGQYGAQVLLDYPSSMVKDGSRPEVAADIKRVLEYTRPATVYTHNLADKHATHIAVAVRVIQAIRDLPKELHPQHLYGCEVWRNLDWMPDEDKIVFDCSSRENLQEALLGVFDSQICGGKRYDLATMGRRRANATFFTSHGVDNSTGLCFGMDLTPLIVDPAMDIAGYVQSYIERFSLNVHSSIAQVSSPNRPGNRKEELR